MWPNFLQSPKHFKRAGLVFTIILCIISAQQLTCTLYVQCLCILSHQTHHQEQMRPVPGNSIGAMYFGFFGSLFCSASVTASSTGSSQSRCCRVRSSITRGRSSACALNGSSALSRIPLLCSTYTAPASSKPAACSSA